MLGRVSMPCRAPHTALRATYALKSPRALRGSRHKRNSLSGTKLLTPAGFLMVLLMKRLFEPFDLFEVVVCSFATPSARRAEECDCAQSYEKQGVACSCIYTPLLHICRSATMRYCPTHSAHKLSELERTMCFAHGQVFDLFEPVACSYQTKGLTDTNN